MTVAKSLRHPLLSLDRRVARLAVKGVQILGLDHIKTALAKTLEQRNDLREVYRSTSLISLETTAPVIGPEGLRQSSRPHLRSTIGNALQLKPIAIGLLHRFTQRVSRAATPFQIHIDAHQLFFLV